MLYGSTPQLPVSLLVVYPKSSISAPKPGLRQPPPKLGRPEAHICIPLKAELFLCWPRLHLPSTMLEGTRIIFACAVAWQVAPLSPLGKTISNSGHQTTG